MKRNDLIKKLTQNGKFGIDWDKALQCVPYNDCNHYILEKCFPLYNDPNLGAAGLNVCARVTVYNASVIDGNYVENSINFKKKGSKQIGTVDCVHTAVCEIPVSEVGEKFGDLKRTKEYVRSLEGRQKEIRLAPEEHFKSLVSYVGGIADIGIGNMVAASNTSGVWTEMPFGFNSAMQSQVLKAIEKVAPGSSTDIVFHLLESLADTSGEWIASRFDLLNETYDFNEKCKIPALVEPCVDLFWDLFGSTTRQAIIEQPTLPASVLDRLSQDWDVHVREAIVWDTNLPLSAIKRLAYDEDEIVRWGVAQRDDIPEEIIELLANDDCEDVRKEIARKRQRR